LERHAVPHLGLLLLISFPDLTAGMVLLHLFTFDPAWLRCGRSFKRTLLGFRRRRLPSASVVPATLLPIDQ
jgi:hypothetical protein